MASSLDHFLPPIRTWFRMTYGEPTPPQALGWPAIQRGENVLIFSPTGSGKTLAAFLWGIQHIFEGLLQDPSLRGVQLLYISPLKALNNDIARNLREPLAGIRHTAKRQGMDLPPLHIAVRTGDTPPSERQRMAKQPPHILITTPESLYLILTSPQAREILRPVQAVIVDEIHTLCGTKRGVHLALSLERLAHLTGREFQRIGLSATQRPLEEVGRFLVGQTWEPDGQGSERLVSRPLTIIDAGMEKRMDLRVVTVVPDLRQVIWGSIWPSLIPHVLEEVRRHRTTLIFTNGRRGAERAADRLNEQYAMEESEEVPPGSPAALLVDGAPKGEGMFGTGRVGGPFRAHHGSVSREVRLDLERKLKAGALPALVATSSLELGIDIGSVDIVLQLQSPRSIARGLQRVGRSGHLVGQTSVGRIYATHREDLLDAAAVAHGMLHGDIEPTYTPRNCLDVLAQQIVAMVACEPWPVEALHRLVRQAYGYQDLSRPALEAVLKMLSGGYPTEAFRELRPRLVWDRVHDVLLPLPGSRLLAIRNGGTIADRGEFRVYLPDRKTCIGTLDEEFVFETQKGDVFALGTNTWRVLDMDEDKLVVTDAAGSLPRMPFWHGELPKRDYHMGLRLGRFRRALAERVRDLPVPETPVGEWPPETQPVLQWLAQEYALDENSARNAAHYVHQQLDVIGAISSDRTIVIETFTDALGDQRMVIHSCFGGRVNSAWALALAHAMREERGLQVEVQVNDDGILFRFLDADREPPIDLVRSLGPEEARERLLAELPNSALFGAQFRMNAGRALLLPGLSGAKRRTPFWLQRLRAKELLAAVRGYEDFPILVETYRDCLRDVLDLEHLLEVLRQIREGEIRIVEAETLVPSPVAAGLLFEFMAVHLYDTDAPHLERQMQALSINRELLGQLLEEGALPDLLRPEAIAQVEQELQHLAEGYQARSAEELLAILHELGDLSTEEVQARAGAGATPWLLRLAAEGLALRLAIPTRQGARSAWIAAEDYWRYRDALLCEGEPPFPPPPDLVPKHTPEAAREVLLRVLLRSHGPLTKEQILARYAFPEDWLDKALEEMVETGRVATGHLSPGAKQTEWCDRRVLERIHRRTLNILRQEVKPVSWAAYAEFTLRWQHVHPAYRLAGEAGLLRALQQLRGYVAPALVWERDLLALRVNNYRPAMLDALSTQGDLVWVASGNEMRRAALQFLFRGEGAWLLAPEPAEGEVPLSEVARAVWAFLRQEGACYASDIQRALGLSAAALDEALIELLLAGLVTNDHFGALRQALEHSPTPPDRPALSALDADLQSWRAQRGPLVGMRPSAARRREARQRIEPRLAPPIRWPGRWSLVHRVGIWGRDVSEEERAEFQARQLLLRYGVVARDLLEREPGVMAWPLLYRQLALMEMRGQVRRGYFVQGLAGLQFALPEAVEALRAGAKELPQEDALTLLNACDPALVYGRGAEAGGEEEVPSSGANGGPGLRFSRLPSNYIVLWQGQPILLYEHGGARWTGLSSDANRLLEAVRLCRDHLTREGGLCSQPRRVLVRTWNGASPLEGEAQWLLERLGFRREPPAMVWDGL